MWNLKYDTIEPIYETETYSQRDIENRLVIAKGRKGWSGRLGFARCKFLYTQWMNNKVLLCSTENYVQYSTIKNNGKEYFKKFVCIYICVCVSIYICIYIMFK